MIVWGLTWFLAGLPLMFFTPPSALHAVALKIWAAGFVVSGVVALTVSTRRTPRADQIGFVALSLVGSLWVVYSLILFGTMLVFDHDTFETAYPPLGTAIVDLLLVVKINIDAGWPEPTDPILSPVDSE